MSRIWVLRAGLLVLLVGSATLWKSNAFFGRLLTGSDAQYYYAVARSLVVDGDLDITNDMQLTPYDPPFDRDGDGERETLHRTPDGRVWHLGTIGLSLVEVPFLLIGRGLRSLLGPFGYTSSSPPGYSDLEIWVVALGLLAITALTVHHLHRLVVPLIGEPFALIAVLGTWVGTSLFYYSSVFPFMPHGVGFAVAVGVVVIAERARSANNANPALLAFGGLSALLLLIRPQVVILTLLIVPFLAPVMRRPSNLWVWGTLGGALLMVAAVGLEVLYSMQTIGVPVWFRYGLEARHSFAWDAPGLGTVLVSPHRGLLRFSPIVLLTLLGYALTRFRGLPWFAWPLLVNAPAQIYIVACWSIPEQGDSFGMRTFVESASVVAVGLVVGFRGLPRGGQLALGAAVAACALWTTHLMVQYVFGAFR